MFVVVVGSRLWISEKAKVQVNRLLDELKVKYSGLVVVTSSTDQGVGAFVRERCMRDRPSFQFIDVHMKIWARLSRTGLARVFFARNTLLMELGEEFHIFVDSNRKGSFEDLIEKIETAEQKRPYSAYLPDPETMLEEGKCPSCGHSLKDNMHGFDQNDGYLEGDKLIHSGRCTYCRECNPRLKEPPEADDAKEG